MTSAFEDQLRELAPQVLGALVRRYGHFDTAEDAVQEALLAAAQQWPVDGVPESPRGWLITVASRRLTDLLRREQSRLRREERVAQWALQGEPVADTDDTLVLLFMCCHPSLSPASQIALTLRAVGGLTTLEIARAFLVPEATMTRRITRAKAAVKESGARFTLPADREERLGAVLHVVYLIFNEGYTTTAGPSLQRVELAAEAIRLARMLHRLLPDDPEVSGLLALLLLTDARRPARTGPFGELVPMAEQDRSLWIPELIQEGVGLITATLPHGPIGPYQMQAAIAAVHDESPSAEETDWPQIVALYEVLLQLTDNPMVALNHVVAVAMARGPAEGLALLDALADDARLAKDHRVPAVRAHLLEMSGDPAAARAAYELAATRTTSLPQQRYLHTRASRL
ncbi:sigma factor-like helix-turn-helix DNA-binding protein [Kribbella hippodromi]|uniref:Sigma factor-like helix-turn-helix DNA-binding protein n=1 Tax=Kribbella hippodromi TaxID=434347 RepID=A0ABN2CHG8_9ACTN